MPEAPGFPLGVWSAADDDEGDATGGDITFQHIFRNTSNNLGDTNLYNIEHIMVASQDLLQVAAQLTINGMDTGGLAPNFPHRPVDRVYSMNLFNTDSTTGFINARHAIECTTPIWVGTYNGVETDLGDMIVGLDNIDSIRVTVAVYGYYWAPDAVNAPGGIQRPPNGLWRA